MTGHERKSQGCTRLYKEIRREYEPSLTVFTSDPLIRVKKNRTVMTYISDFMIRLRKEERRYLT